MALFIEAEGFGGQVVSINVENIDYINGTTVKFTGGNEIDLDNLMKTARVLAAITKGRTDE